MRLLVVEDDPTNRALLRAILSTARDPAIDPSRVREAATLSEARYFLASETFDVILLDVRLPDGNGLDLARELSLLRPGARPAIIVMSASVLTHERDAALDAGGDMFLSKPYRPAELLGLLERLAAVRT